MSLLSRVAAGSITLLATALLAGCSLISETPLPGPESPEPGSAGMGYEEAQAELDALFEQLSALVPGEWDITSTGARGCALGDGATGALTLRLGLGPGVAAGQEQDTADRVVALFAQQGKETSVSDRSATGGPLFLEVRYPADAVADADGLGIIMNIGSEASTLDGQSRCGIGDADQINSDRQEREG